jgi:hypothetical protein
VRRGSGYSLPQSDTQWNLKSPPSSNSARWMLAMAAGVEALSLVRLAPVSFRHQQAHLGRIDANHKYFRTGGTWAICTR